MYKYTYIYTIVRIQCYFILCFPIGGPVCGESFRPCWPVLPQGDVWSYMMMGIRRTKDTGFIPMNHEIGYPLVILRGCYCFNGNLEETNMNQLVMRKAEVTPFEMKRLCLNRTGLAVDLPIWSIITPYQSNSQIEQWETWKYKVNTGNDFLSFWGFLYHL